MRSSKGRHRPFLSKLNRVVLLVQLHADIAEAAATTVRELWEGASPFHLTYPPNDELTREEADALRILQGVPHLDSALRKILADTAADPVFRLLACIDGVRDPNEAGWTGVRLVDRRAEEDEPDESFLHDDFYDTFREWRRRESEKRQAAPTGEKSAYWQDVIDVRKP